MRKFAHIINPVVVKESSDLYAAQPVTFETLRVARKLAQGSVDVTLLSAQYEEDRKVVPDFLRTTPDLTHSVLDFGEFKRKRKFPILKDILDRMYDAAPDAEYLVYTNVDIALMPGFYLALDALIGEGFDAFVINRRTITDRYKRVEEIPLMYSESGESHPGHDCFVFRRDAYPGFRLCNVCIGINWVGRALIYNLVCHAQNFKEFKRKHLTFHLGNDKTWKKDEYTDYVAHNKRELLKILAELERQYGPFDRNGPLFSYLTDVKLYEHIQIRNSLLGKLADSARKIIGRLK